MNSPSGKPWKPRGATAALLDRAWEHVESVPYRASLRWLFYRLLQDGLYTSKEQYHGFVCLMSEARKREWEDWRPDTLVDDTIGITQRGAGYKKPSAWVADLPTIVTDLIEAQAVVSHHFKQHNYCEVWFEARAMVNQFRHYTRGLTLVPFGGDQHIEPKWDTAKRIEEMHQILRKPVVVLYFGDRDDKGDCILRDALKDIEQWCSVPFAVERCGLTLEQVDEFAVDDHGQPVPENPDRPGEYQWEALTDSQAKTIIEAGVRRWLDVDLIEKTEKTAKRLRKKWAPRLQAAVEAEIANR